MEQQIKHVLGRPFAKGVSGNPGGRPREEREVLELARQHSPEAIQTLVEIMRHGASDKARVAAANALLDRGFGKPHQSLGIQAAVRIPPTVRICSPVN